MTSIMLAGVNEDIELILYTFMNQKYYTFGTFTEVWKELKFYHIFSGRPTVFEMKHFTKELLLLVKSYALPKYTKWERSGAIFLLYALYFTQPLSQKVLIRIEQNEWEELCQFTKEMKSVNMEVSYCFCNLVANNAFHYVFTNKPYNFELMKEDEVPKKGSQAKPQQKKYKYDKFAMGSLLTSIGFDPKASSAREDCYNDIKLALNQKFPEKCNFEIRRFAVNLLVPTAVDEDKMKASTSGTQNSSKKLKRKAKKKKTPSDVSLFATENEIVESTFSMPNINSDESEQD